MVDEFTISKLIPNLQRYKDTVWSVTLGVDVQGLLQGLFSCAFVENALLIVVPKIGRSQAPFKNSKQCELVTRPVA